MVFVKTWDEAAPAGTRSISLGDDDIRDFKYAIRERLAVDHNVYADESGQTNVGAHNKVTLVEQGSDPSSAANTGKVYTKDVGGITELYYIDSAGTVQQLTSDGKVYVANNAYLVARNAAGNGTVNLIKASTADKPVLPDGTETATNAAPTTDVQITNKKYVNDFASNATNITSGTLPLGRLTTYVSTWFNVALQSVYPITHGLGTSALLIQVYYSESADGSNAIKVYSESSNNRECSISGISTTALTITTAATSLAHYFTGGTTTYYTSGYYRVLVLAIG
jgi:hypothetical protein